MTEQQVLNPDIFAFELGQKAIKRSALLAGFGLNLSTKAKPEDVQIPSDRLFKIVNLRQPRNQKELQEYQTQFSEMIIRSSIREFIETWAVFLDRLYELCLICLKQKNILKITKIESGFIYKAGKYGCLKTENNFQKDNFKEKIDYLTKRFNLASKYDNMFTQTAILRNCYAHNAGIMPEMYAKTDDSFTYQWLGLNLFLLNEATGDILDITNLTELDSTENSSPQLELTTREVKFPLHSICQLSSVQLQEILFGASLALFELRQKFFIFAESIGMDISSASPTSSA